jgi:hypothetical protein
MNVLEINDAGLLLSDGERLLADSAGYAAQDGKQLLTGAAARARSRLDPRRSHNRFWYQLEAPLPAPLGEVRTQSDLAYAQLQEIRETAADAPLILAVPGTFSREQLGLLLGVVEAAQLKAKGLVDAAVAAAASCPTDARTLHLDVQLHRFVLTVIDGGAEVSRVRADEIEKPGLTAIWEAVSKLATEVFLQQTRFDPMHSAATEQAMFDALPQWLDALSAAPNAVLELASGTRRHRANLVREDLVERLRERYDAIAAALMAHARPRPVSLLLSARAATVPGLAEHLERVTGLAAFKLDPLAPARGALAQAARIVSEEGGGLAYVTRLGGQARVAAADASSEATHVLCGERAVRLPHADRDAPLPLSRFQAEAPGVLRRIEERLWLDGEAAGVQVNGKPVRLPVRVGLGDRIDVAGLQLRLIEVAP